MKQHRLAVLITALALAATAGYAQYVEDSIDVGGRWVGSLVYNSRENVVYGASGDGLVFTIACDSNRLIRSVPVTGALDLAYDSIGNKAYCTAGGGEGTVAVIDGATHGVIRSIPMPGSTFIIWDPVRNRMYVSCDEYQTVGVIDCATDSVIAMIPVPGDAWKLGMNPAGRRLYVHNYNAESLTIIEMDLNAVIRTLPVGDIPMSGCYCPTQDKYYCATLGEALVVCGRGDTAIRRVELPGQPRTDFGAMLWVPQSRFVLACGNHGTSRDTVAVIDPGLDSVVAVVAVGGQPEALTIGTNPAYVYCANAATQSISVIDANELVVVASLRVAWYPFAFATSAVSGRTFVGHLGSRRAYVLSDSGSAMQEVSGAALDRLLTASPSPFWQRVRLRVATGQGSPERIHVFSEAGALIATRSLGLDERGGHSGTWDGRDLNGVRVPPGVYFIAASGFEPVKVVKVGP